MKKTARLISLLTALIIASTAQASGTPKTFIGRYRPDASACKGDMRLFQRVYVKIAAANRVNPTGALILSAYGKDEPSTIEIPLGQGVRQAPGTSKDVHGEVRNEWTTEINGRYLLSEQRTTRPSIDFEYRLLTKLTRLSDGLIISVKSQERGQKPVQETYCELVEY